MRVWPSLLALGVCACSNYPRDIDGTFDRITDQHTIRVGYATLTPAQTALANGFVNRLESATGAHAMLTVGPGERQLALLEAGKLDLVLGEFAEDSPWLGDVALIEPLTRHRSGDRTLGLAPVAANGENRWIMLLERTVRQTRQGMPR